EDIPRQEHHSLTQRGKSALDFTIETDAVDARHLGVAEDQVIGSLREELQRPIAAQCNLDVMSHPLQGFGEHPGELWFIVNDEDRLGADRGKGGEHGRRGRSRGPEGARQDREVDLEGGSLAGSAGDRDRAAVLLDDPLAQREPEARPLARRLGREERLKDLGLNVARDPGAGIGDRELDTRPLTGEAGRDGDPARGGQAPHRLMRVATRLTTTWWSGWASAQRTGRASARSRTASMLSVRSS